MKTAFPFVKPIINEAEAGRKPSKSQDINGLIIYAAQEIAAGKPTHRSDWTSQRMRKYREEFGEEAYRKIPLPLLYSEPEELVTYRG